MMGGRHRLFHMQLSVLFAVLWVNGVSSQTALMVYNTTLRVYVVQEDRYLPGNILVAGENFAKSIRLTNPPAVAWSPIISGNLLGLDQSSNGEITIVSNHGLSCVHYYNRSATVVSATKMMGNCYSPGDIDGEAATSRLSNPRSIVYLDENVSEPPILFILDSGNNKLKRLQNGMVTTVCDGLTDSQSISLYGPHLLYTNLHSISRIDTSTCRLARVVASSLLGGSASGWDDTSPYAFNVPMNTHYDPSSNALYVVDHGNFAIRVFDINTSVMKTVCRNGFHVSGGSSSECSMGLPYDVTVIGDQMYAVGYSPETSMGYVMSIPLSISGQSTTTAPPTTAIPTTAPPTTAIPTKAIPTTAPPTTANPTTAPPTTAPPTTTIPTTTPIITPSTAAESDTTSRTTEIATTTELDSSSEMDEWGNMTMLLTKGTAVLAIEEDFHQPGSLLIAGSNYIVSFNPITKTHNWAVGSGGLSIYQLAQTPLHSSKIYVVQRLKFCVYECIGIPDFNSCGRIAGDCANYGDVSSGFLSSRFNFIEGLMWHVEQSVNILYVCDYGNHKLKEMNFDTNTVKVLSLVANPWIYSMNWLVFETGSTYVMYSVDNSLECMTKAGATLFTLGHADIEGFVDGTGSEARFKSVKGTYFHDPLLFIADMGNNRIRIYNYSTGLVTSLCDGRGAVAEGDHNTCSVRLPTDVTVVNGVVYVGGESGGGGGYVMAMPLTDAPVETTTTSTTTATTTTTTDDITSTVTAAAERTLVSTTTFAASVSSSSVSVATSTAITPTTSAITTITNALPTTTHSATTTLTSSVAGYSTTLSTTTIGRDEISTAQTAQLTIHRTFPLTTFPASPTPTDNTPSTGATLSATTSSTATTPTDIQVTEGGKRKYLAQGSAGCMFVRVNGPCLVQESIASTDEAHCSVVCKRRASCTHMKYDSSSGLCFLGDSVSLAVPQEIQDCFIKS